MNEVRWLKTLKTTEPRHANVDVAAKVLQSLSTRPRARDDDRVIPLAAVLAVVAGTAAWVFAGAVTSDSSSADSFSTYGDVVNLVLR